MEIVYIGAKWCGSCKTIQPKIEQLAKLYVLKFKYLDYDDDIDECDKDNITKVPTIQIIGYDGHKLMEFNMDQVNKTNTWLSQNVSVKSADDF